MISGFEAFAKPHDETHEYDQDSSLTCPVHESVPVHVDPLDWRIAPVILYVDQFQSVERGPRHSREYPVLPASHAGRAAEPAPRQLCGW